MDFSKSGTTSVKVHHAPGGSSSFSLAWDTEPTRPTKPRNTPLQQIQPQTQLPQTQTTGEKTSVKVHNPPGGRSNITFF